MNGQMVLENIVKNLASIDPDDQLCRFCQLLLRITQPLLEGNADGMS